MHSYRVVVAGCGGMAKSWVQYASKRPDRIQIVALVDLYEASARAMADKFGLDAPVFTDLAHALSSVQADVVFDVTIPQSHKFIATTAMLAGCHVLSEKPMAASMEETRELVALAERTGRMYAIMQNRRYDPRIRSFRQLIADGTIGQVGSIHADFFLAPHFGGFREAMDSPLLLDMAIHTFDQARFITGADPVSVYCHEFNPPGSWYQGNASAVCIFEMSDGSVFCYRGSWCAEGFTTSWEADWRVNGSKGTARWDGTGMPECEIVAGVNEDGKRQFERLEGRDVYEGASGHAGCLDEMFAALGEGRDAETVCTDNIKSMAMVFGAIESARLGRKVAL